MPLALELGSVRDPATQRALQIIAMQFPVVAAGGGGGAETDPIASPALASHAALTTTAHGGIVASTDPRLTDARAPTAHKTSHEPGGTDVLTGLTNASIAAGAGIAKTKLASLDVVNADVNAAAAIARSKLDFGSGLVNADIAAAAAIAKTKLAALAIVNADVDAAAAIAESKLSLATDAAAGTGSRRTIGTGALQAAAGNDARFTDARTPTAHATTHQPGGSDAMAVDAAAATGSLRTLGTTSTSAASGDRGVPTGGTSGQVLAKNSATNYDAGWVAAGGSPATVLTQYKTIEWSTTNVPTLGAAGTQLASRFGGAGAIAGAATGVFAFYIDPADLNFTGTTNKIRLRTSLHVNAVAPTGTQTLGLYPVATWGGASGAVPTIATISAATVSNAYVAPAASSHTKTDSVDVNFPTAGWYVFAYSVSGAMAAGSQTVAMFELQARQI